MNAYLKSRLHKPAQHQAFWCNKCDSKMVNSNIDTSGDFFVIFGHGYDAHSKDYTGYYGGVMFALCKPCQKENDHG